MPLDWRCTDIANRRLRLAQTFALPQLSSLPRLRSFVDFVTEWRRPDMSSRNGFYKDGRGQSSRLPMLILTIVPVIGLAASEATNAATLAISDRVVSRRACVLLAIRS